MIATICSSENRPFRIAPSESGASLSTYRWSENPRAGHPGKTRTTRALLTPALKRPHSTWSRVGAVLAAV
jgi:hypothetical protein